MADAGGGLTAAPSAEQLLAAAPTPLLAVDGDDRVRHANAAAEALVNASRAAMTGRPLAELLGDIVPEGAPVAAYDRSLPYHGGRAQGADLLAAPLPERPGWRIVAVHPHPATPLARGGGDGRSAAGAAAMLAHEIKNPLAGIRGAAQLLDSSVSGEAQGLTRLIRDEVDRIARLIDRMAHFTDTRPLALAPQNIHAILNHARQVAAPALPPAAVLREDYDPSLPEVLGNRDALIQVFLNLLKNAGHALEQEGGLLLLTTAYRTGVHRRDGASGARRALPIEVCVIDDGPGAPAEIADQLFEPFVTSSPTGQGLGLALVRKLVGDMGGLVEYAREGRPSRTVFRVLLPRAEAAA